MRRIETPVDPMAGPTAEVACELRKLRRKGSVCPCVLGRVCPRVSPRGNPANQEPAAAVDIHALVYMLIIKLRERWGWQRHQVTLREVGRDSCCTAGVRICREQCV